jgi:type IV pilus assembly protein PilA
MRFIEKAQRRLRGEESGFTLIELLVVLIIIGILLAIAVPSYIGFKARAEQRSASANVRTALPAAEAYYADNGTYVGMDIAALQAIDAGVKVTTVSGLAVDAYTLCSEVGSKAAFVNGPGGTITDDADGAC